MRGLERALLLCVSGAAMLAAAGVRGQDVERGRMLYENHCRMCHDSVAFKRGDRIARNLEQVKAQVSRWQANTGLRWSTEDIDSVTGYVGKTFYNYPVRDDGK
jgi:mono/diheme cytochrome c family protein